MCLTLGTKLKPAVHTTKNLSGPHHSVPFILLNNQMYYLYFMAHGICCLVYTSNENDSAIE